MPVVVRRGRPVPHHEVLRHEDQQVHARPRHLARDARQGRGEELPQRRAEPERVPAQAAVARRRSSRRRCSTTRSRSTCSAAPTRARPRSCCAGPSTRTATPTRRSTCGPRPCAPGGSARSRCTARGSRSRRRSGRPSTRRVPRTRWPGIGPEDVDVIQLQDTDAGAEVIHLAENGFCADGEQEALVADGALEIDGRAAGEHRRRAHRQRRADRRVGPAPGARGRAAAARPGGRPPGARATRRSATPSSTARPAPPASRSSRSEPRADDGHPRHAGAGRAPPLRAAARPRARARDGRPPRRRARAEAPGRRGARRGLARAARRRRATGAARGRRRGRDRRRRARRRGRRRRVRRARCSPAISLAAPASDAATARGRVLAATLRDAAVVAGDRRRDADVRGRRRRRRRRRRYVLVPEGAGYRLGAACRVDAGAPTAPTSPDRCVAIPPGAPVRPSTTNGASLTDDDLAAWTALGLALTSADLVGVMRGVLDVTVAYAAERRQYGVPVGSFQAVQHLLAEAHCLMEGSLSVALHASWAVDNLAPDDALRRRPRRQGVLRPRRAHRVRDRGAGARRHRQHVGVHRARVPAARAAVVAVVRRRRRAAPRARSDERLGVTDGLS